MIYKPYSTEHVKVLYLMSKCCIKQKVSEENMPLNPPPSSTVLAFNLILYTDKTELDKRIGEQICQNKNGACLHTMCQS